MKYIYIIFVFLTLTAFNVYPQSGWVLQSPLPSLTALVSVKFIDNNTGVSVGSVGSIIKTTNGGANWKNVNSNTTKYLRYLVFINSTTGFAVGDSSVIIKSTNAGENWSISYNSNSRYSIRCISFINSNTGYAYQDSSNVIMKTTNCGNNWNSINTDLIGKPFDQSLLFINENTGYYYCAYIYKTTNGGVNWLLKDNSSYVPYCLNFFDQYTGIAAGLNGNITKTTNGGENWTFLTQVTPVSNIKDMKFLDSLNGYLFSREIGLVYRTTDKGNSWTALMGSAYSGNLSFDFSDINTGYINSVPGRIIKTTNAGINWTVISSGTRNTLFSVHFANSNTGFAVGSDAIVKTTNGGNFWINLNNGYGHFVYVHCLDSSNIVSAASGFVQKSTNAGLSWEIKENVSSGNLRAACFINNTGYYNAGTLIGKTTDGGETWQQITTVTSSFDKMFFLNENTGFAGYFGPHLFKTVNGGVNWDLVYDGGLNDDIKSITFFDSLNGILITDRYYVKTTNGGINWVANVLPISGYITSSFAVNFNNFYVAYGSSILKTTNSGQNWFAQPLSVNRLINDIYFLDTLRGYAVGEIGAIFSTTDGGGQVWVNNTSENIPINYFLSQNYPNPFNPSTTIKFALPKAADVKVAVYDITGKELEVLVNERLHSGTYQTIWNGERFSSGVYFYKIQTDDFVQSKRMLLIK